MNQENHENDIKDKVYKFTQIMLSNDYTKTEHVQIKKYNYENVLRTKT